MKSLIILVASAVLSTAQGSVIIGPSVYNGPITLSRSPYEPPLYSDIHTVPVISAGHVVQNSPAVSVPVRAVPVPVPVRAAPVAPAAPVLHQAQLVPAAPAPVVSTPVRSFSSDEAIISGPSGTITTKKISAQPGIIAYPAPIVPAKVASQTVVKKYAPSSSKVAFRRREQLVPSPFGPVPAGHGAEGAYVPDYKEKYYDDGSYRPEYY